jgi:hypothetical protein
MSDGGDRVMSWISVAGKTLEFSGKVIQSASFEEWARSKGEDIVERVAQERTISLFGKRRAARNDLWKDLKLITKQPALRAALSKLALDYSVTIANVAEAFESNEFTANGKTYVIPRLLVNPWHRALLERELSPSDEFQKLKGGPLLQSYFYEEFIRQLDAAFAKMRPNPNDPVRLGVTTWYVVGMNQDYDWRVDDDNWRGHFFVFGSTNNLSEKKSRRDALPSIQAEIAQLDRQMGLFSKKQKQSFALPWVQMREDLIAGGRGKVAMPLMAEPPTDP